jgi:hypothetical protein
MNQAICCKFIIIYVFRWTRLELMHITDWGDWSKEFSYCKEYQKTIGFTTKLEFFNNNKNYDNSMLNSIKLICEDGSEISAGEGDWGEWGYWFSRYMIKYDSYTKKEWIKYEVKCPKGTYLNGFKLKVQPYQGTEKDDTATNDIIMFCHKHNSTIELPSRQNEWYDSGKWSSAKMCPENEFIRGFNLQIEKDQGDGDDTGLNNVIMDCSDNE